MFHQIKRNMIWHKRPLKALLIKLLILELEPNFIAEVRLVNTEITSLILCWKLNGLTTLKFM